MKTMVYNYPHPFDGPHFFKVYLSENATQFMFRHNKHQDSRITQKIDFFQNSKMNSKMFLDIVGSLQHQN